MDVRAALRPRQLIRSILLSAGRGGLRHRPEDGIARRLDLFFFLPWWSAKSTSPLVRLGAGDWVFQPEDNCGIRDVMLVAMCLRGCHCAEYIHPRPWFPMHGFNSDTRFALGAFRLRQVLEYIPLKKDIKKKQRSSKAYQYQSHKPPQLPNSCPN